MEMKSSRRSFSQPTVTCTATQSPVIALLSRKFAVERAAAFIFSGTNISSSLSPGFPYLIPGLVVAVALEARKILHPPPSIPLFLSPLFHGAGWRRNYYRCSPVRRLPPSMHTMQTRTPSRDAQYKRETRTACFNGELNVCTYT